MGASRLSLVVVIAGLVVWCVLHVSAAPVSKKNEPTGSAAVLGSFGYGALKLGATRRQVEATGEVAGLEPQPQYYGCASGYLAAAPTGTREGLVTINTE